jgi:hypothetical protein
VAIVEGRTGGTALVLPAEGLTGNAVAMPGAGRGTWSTLQARKAPALNRSAAAAAIHRTRVGVTLAERLVRP